MSTYKIIRANDSNDLAVSASQLIASYINLALEEKDRAQIALPGGSTPAATYKLLAKEHLPWDRVDVFLGDERWVDSKSSSSNSLMLRETLLLKGPGKEARFHPVPISGLSSPEESAKSFSDIITKNCIGEPPIFDLIVLGLGEDGHTASLFPQTKSLNVKDRWVAASIGQGLARITLTAPVLCMARKIIFLVSGSNKQIALQRLIDPSEAYERTPARLVQTKTEILIIADKISCELI